MTNSPQELCRSVTASDAGTGGKDATGRGGSDSFAAIPTQIVGKPAAGERGGYERRRRAIEAECARPALILRSRFFARERVGKGNTTMV
jgi:hypothetical protein